MLREIIGKNFIGENLVGTNQSGSTFLECKFNHMKLAGTDFSESNLYRSDFVGSDLYGMIISLSCFTFRDVRFDRKQVKQFLYLLQLADIDINLKTAIQDLIGKEQLEVFRRVFRFSTDHI